MTLGNFMVTTLLLVVVTAQADIANTDEVDAIVPVQTLYEEMSDDYQASLKRPTESLYGQESIDFEKSLKKAPSTFKDPDAVVVEQEEPVVTELIQQRDRSRSGKEEGERESSTIDELDPKKIVEAMAGLKAYCILTQDVAKGTHRKEGNAIIGLILEFGDEVPDPAMKTVTTNGVTFQVKRKADKDYNLIANFAHTLSKLRTTFKMGISTYLLLAVRQAVLNGKYSKDASMAVLKSYSDHHSHMAKGQKKVMLNPDTLGFIDTPDYFMDLAVPVTKFATKYQEVYRKSIVGGDDVLRAASGLAKLQSSIKYERYKEELKGIRKEKDDAFEDAKIESSLNKMHKVANSKDLIAINAAAKEGAGIPAAPTEKGNGIIDDEAHEVADKWAKEKSATLSNDLPAVIDGIEGTTAPAGEEKTKLNIKAEIKHKSGEISEKADVAIAKQKEIEAEAKEADEKVKLKAAEANTKEAKVKEKAAQEQVSKHDTEKREKAAVIKEMLNKRAKRDQAAIEQMEKDAEEMVGKMMAKAKKENGKEVESTMSKLVSVGKTARQSSTTNGGVAGRAVDGDTSQNYGENSCTHTSDEVAWWSVDLERVHNVNKVEVYNRIDCCSSRLAKVKVVVDGETCGEIINPKPLNTVHCNGKLGSTVRLEASQKVPLNVCEVKVYGVVASYAESYKGCYKDNSARDLKHGPKEFGYTTTTCMVKCRNYKFIALQNSDWCSCDNDYSTPAATYTKVVDTECRGGGGGSMRNAVYKNMKYGLKLAEAEKASPAEFLGVIPVMPTTGGFCSGRGSPLKMTIVATWDDCGKSCLDYADCSCFEFNKNDKQCRLTKGEATSGGPCCRSAQIKSHGNIPMV